MNVHAGFVRREEMVELQRMLSEHVNLNDALKKKNIELEDEVKDLLDWQEELTQNAKEAEKDFNVKHRLWTEENSILQNRNRALSDERDKKDKEVSDAKDQLQIAQQAAQRAEEQLNQMTIAYREIRGTHEGLPDRYEAAKQAAKEASESLAARDATIHSLQGQLSAKQVELDVLSGSTESRTGQLQQALDAERQRHVKEMSEAHRRWEENLAKVQGDKVMAEACAEQIKAELQDLQKRFNSMKAEVQTRDERAGSQIKQLEADVAKQVEAVAQAQSALKSAQEDLEKQRAVVVDAEAAMKAAQAESAAAAEKMQIEKETGAEYTEEAIRAVTAADVQLQQAKERDEELARREKQIEAREALVQQELQQREQALDGQLKEIEDAAAARVKEAEEQVGAVIEKEREAMKKASSEEQRQLQADLDASQQHCSELQEQIASLKQELSEAANAMDVDGEAENGAVNERLSGLQEKEAELKRSVGELERRSEKLQNEVTTAAAAKEELTRLRKDVRDVSSQREELENLVRELQKEEFALRTRITGAKAAHTAAPLGNSGSKHDSVPAAAGSGPVLSVPFGSPALPAAAVLANAGRGKKNGANASEQEELLLSPGDGAAKSNNTPLSNAEPSQNQLSTPASKGSGLFGGLLSKAAGIFGGSAMPNSGHTPGLLADSVERIPVDAGAAQAGTAAVEFSPPGGPEIACTPRIGSGVGARTSANAAAKQRNQRAQQAGAAADPARPADVSPEGTARLAARAKAAADAAAGKAGAKGADSGAPNTRKGAQGASAAGSIPKRPLSGSKRRRGVEEIPAAGQVEEDVEDIKAAEAEPAAAPEPTASEQRTSKLNNLAGALAGNTLTVGKATRGAKSGIGKGIPAADGGTDRARKRVTHKSAKDTASAGQPAATAARASQRKAAMSAAATPRGDSDAAQQNITPPKIGTGAAAATRGGATAADHRRKRAAGDDAKSGTTSVSKSGISAGLRRTASKEPVSKRRAVARDGNGAGTSATAVAGTSGANDHASGWKGKPLQIPKSTDAEEPANDGESNEGDDGENPSTPHHMSARVQHLVEEAAAYTGYSPAELVNEDGQPISARALRAASRAQSRSTMTPGKGVEEGEEAEGGAANLPTPRTRRTGLRTRRRSLHDIEENEEELSAGEDAE